MGFNSWLDNNITIFYAKLWQFLPGVMLSCVFFTFGYFFDLRGLHDKLMRLSAEQRELQQLWCSKQRSMGQKRESSNTATMLPSQLLLLSAIGQNFNNTEILHEIEQALFKAHVVLSSLEPLAITKADGLLSYPFRLQFNGTYCEVLSFINVMLASTHLIGFDSVKLQKMAEVENDELKVNIVLSAYRVYDSPLFTAKTNATKQAWPVITIKPPETSVFVRAKTKSVKSDLFLWAERELKFLGVLQQAHTTYGILVDPMGGVHRVTVGARVGLKQHKITAISSSGIITENNSANINRR